MKHYVAYHNEQRMGGPLSEDNPFLVLSNRALEYTMGQVVWFITSKGGRDADYFLESAFVVNETGPAAHQGFSHYARGVGKQFDLPIALNDLPWFGDLLHQMGNFGRGVAQVTDETAVEGLLELGRQEGWEPEEVE